ncbi:MULTISPECIES: hybrid sensor histidine kinase/response regulator [unclassified Leptolyngbya]|uniref:hybrid sensor histidine kinase/response regulator n=1 Tax=unclassified Leptolyngbya TaxID=2650499 RepID=UPI00168A27A7|nr:MULTISPECIES: hybrid sensor histidine kinase/response regulator [unclassified Leptolyngbya]MBD1909415.1 response regulator [Leptolyngbya sp. FACHB-8]MBD2157598.1 response regulator [Leptolyngbya sp. FACHB-16]
MAIHPDIRDEAFLFFVQEAPELLQIIEAELLEIRQECTVERVHALMRAAHTIKGGSANVGLEAIKTIAHRLEDYFRCLYNSDLQVDEALERLFLQAYDCLRNPLLEAIQLGDRWEEGESALTAAEPIFAELQERLADFITGEDHLPSVAEMGIDIVKNIFETDVAQALERLESIEGDEQLIGGELRAQAEVFEGIAELFNLPGLTQIAHLILAALEAEPNRASELFPIAMENFKAAHHAVLGGDRSQGGTPSPALQSFVQSKGEEDPISPDDIPSDELWLGSSGFFNEGPSWFEMPALRDAVPDDSCFSSTESFLSNEGGDRSYTDLESVFDPEDMPTFDPNDTGLESIFSTQDVSVFDSDDANLESVFSIEDTSVFDSGNANLESVFSIEDTSIFDSGDANLESVFGVEDASTFADDTDLESVFGVEDAPTFADDADVDSAFSPQETSVLNSGDVDLESVFSIQGLPTTNPNDAGLESVFNLQDTSVFDASEVDLESVFSLQDTSSFGSDEPDLLTELESVFAAEDLQAVESDVLSTSVTDLESGFIPDNTPPFLEEGLTSAAESSPEALFVEAPPTESLRAEEQPSNEQGNVGSTGTGHTNLVGSAIAAIQQSFDQLPIVSEPAPVELHPTKATNTTAKTNSAQPSQNTANNNQISVRLNLDQLERISNQLGELSINRNSLSLQNEQLQETLQELRRRFGKFLTIGTQLQVHLNKLLVSPERYQKNYSAATQERSPVPTIILEKGTDLSYRAAFDTLELDRYNEVYNLLQEATESIQQLDEAVEDVTLFAEQSDRGLEQQRQILTVLRDELMWARMLPLGNILNRFPRQIKELSYQYKKPVALKLTGTEVLVDKVVLEKLYDPLLHLLRNAFDHGIEPSDDRKQQGKPEQGSIHIRVYHRGSRTVIEIEDDGRGINFERIRAKAIDNGLLTTEVAKTVSNERLLNLIFEPGFSTASQVSELSGRGVGLDIVRAQIQSLKGSISVNSKPGKGTLFTLRIPLTLSISKLLLTWSGASLAAIPSDSIEEIVNPNPSDIKTSGAQPFLYWRRQVIPIHSLQDLLPFNCVLPTVEANLSFNSVPTPEEWAAPLLILRQGNQPFALQVERLITEQELIIKPFSDTLAAPTYLYGCTILGDGSVVPVVDAVTLLLHRQSNRLTAIAPPTKVSAQPVQTTSTILIVDDAATMRQMLTLTLKKAGYQVMQARDGREALEQLHQHPQIRLVICDIEMPTMNGFEFLTHRRQAPDLLNIPVIMLTSRSGEKHRKLALHLGATNYFTKPYIEQQFLSQISTLLQANSSS